MKRISELRKKHNISQRQLGKILGAAQNTVSNWEKGIREPDNDTLKRISEYFDVSVDYLLNDNDSGDTAIEVYTVESDDTASESDRLYQAYINADDGIRKAIDKLLDL